jgi:hypothetical protein
VRTYRINDHDSGRMHMNDNAEGVESESAELLRSLVGYGGRSPEGRW